MKFWVDDAQLSFKYWMEEMYEWHSTINNGNGLLSGPWLLSKQEHFYMHILTRQGLVYLTEVIEPGSQLGVPPPPTQTICQGKYSVM